MGALEIAQELRKEIADLKTENQELKIEIEVLKTLLGVHQGK